MEPTQNPLRIVVIGDPHNPILEELNHLHEDAQVIGIYNNAHEAFENPSAVEELLHANTILNVSGNGESLSGFLPLMPSLSWVHTITAGLDHLWCDELLMDSDIKVSNAKGIFSKTLGEYVIGACLYFAKDFPKLMQQRNDKVWSRFHMKELRNCTMGIVGYGDIGRTCANLAKAFGMKISSYRRRIELSDGDPLVDSSYGPGRILEMMGECDYLVICAPLTSDTMDLIGETELNAAKPGQVIINIGRGPIINEAALIAALKSKDRIYGCALDVFNTEPLPKSSELWTLPNVLLSPHNADFTTQSRRNSVRYFTDLCDKVVRGEPISYVDKSSKY